MKEDKLISGGIYWRTIHNENIFNYQLFTARRIVENDLITIASQFRVFLQLIENDIES